LLTWVKEKPVAALPAVNGKARKISGGTVRQQTLSRRFRVA